MPSVPRTLPCLLATALAPALALAAPVDHGAGDPLPDSTIVGGAPAQAGKWPDVVAVMDGGGQFCTGTLIAPDVVLTAGHCTDGITATQVRVNATSSTSGGELIPVVRQIGYPSWETSFDVGVLVLGRAATVAPRSVLPACAADALTDSAPVDLVG
jgi:trypsin